ncbi:cbbx protein [Tribonema minus]|uniref:Cbbx protein n=1 Tax=Tribonema minus TaxID=303371 RepID=A0A835Z7C7_9STRA|nr:cbbx protein [Tribonema minus]
MRTTLIATLAVACASGALGFAPVTQLRAGVSTSKSSLAMQATGTGSSLQYDPEKYKDPNAGNYRRLSDSLQAADVEARKVAEEAEKRERAAEIRREERMAKITYMKDMDDALEVGTVEDFMFKEGVRDILDRLDTDLVGLVPVKKRVREIAALLVLDKMRGKLGFETAVPSLHMCFTGAPGTGKTTVALRMGQILARMGYCRLGHVIVATRDDLVGQYVGHTAPKTKDMIKKAFGGILLVDEAYYLYNASNDKDYGQESIEILLNVMENQKEDLIVTLAGYKDRMDKFFSYIPGMSSRIGNHIDFPNYEKEELVEIAQVMARDLQYTMDDAAAAKFQEYINLRMKFPFFSNARTVRNAMDRARMNSAIRVFNDSVNIEGSDGLVSAADLATITAADFQILLDELEHYKSIGKMDAIVA